MGTTKDLILEPGVSPQRAYGSTGKIADGEVTKPNESLDAKHVMPLKVHVKAPTVPERVKTTGDGGVTVDDGERMSYAQMYDMMNSRLVETPEQKAAREKKEKRQAIFSAIGDGISALSNLWFTHKGAPNAYDATQGMSAKTRARWDKLRAEREANRRIYNDGYMRALSMDAAQGEKDRAWKERLAARQFEMELKQKEADLNAQLKGHQIGEAEYKKELAKIKAEHAEENEKLNQENARAGIRQKNASADSSYARANYYNGASKGPTLHLEAGDEHYGNLQDYEKAVMRLAPEYGVPTTTVEVTERDYKGNPRKQRTTRRDVKAIAADIEREAAKRKESNQNSNTMPGVEERDDNTMPGVK